MKRSVTASLLFVLMLAAAMAAQKPSPCPTLSLTSPDEVASGEPITFSINVSGGDLNVNPTYNWTVSAGTISSGQGTPTVAVDTTGIGGQTVTATVEIGGLAPECDRTRSSTTMVAKNPEASKFDEFGAIKKEDEMARLDNFAIGLQNDPTAQGYILVYAGRKTKRSAATAAAIIRIKNYLVKTRRMDASRLVTIDGGYREEPSRELFIVPSGAAPPTASPTVDPSEIKKPKKPAGKKT